MQQHGSFQPVTTDPGAGWNDAIKAKHPKAAARHEAEMEGPPPPLDHGTWPD